MYTWAEHTLELPTGGTTLVHEAPGPAGQRPDAPTLVLLHGLGATARLNWMTSLGPLGQHFRVIAFDQRGHGRGVPADSGPFRLERCADDVGVVTEQLGVRRMIVVGYSMGGAVAQLFWRRQPSRVDGLVLCATAGRFADQRLQRVAHLTGPIVSLAARLAPDSAWQRASQQFLGSPNLSNEARRRMQQELRASNPKAVLEASLAIAAFNSEAWLPQINVPAAVVFTTEDLHVPPRRQQTLANSIRGAKVFPVAADHIACARRPDLFVPQLLEASRWVKERISAKATA